MSLRDKAQSWLDAYSRDEVELTVDSLEELLKSTYREALEKTPVFMVEALAFYADPGTYTACGFLFDPPCGPFREDFGDTPLGRKPGATARAACLRVLDPLGPEEEG